MKKVFLIISIIYLSSGISFAKKVDTLSIFNNVNYSISYFGNSLIKPGLKMGANIPLFEKKTIRTKTSRKGETIDKSKKRQLFVGGDIGFICFPKSHTGIFNYYEIKYKSIKARNASFSTFALGPGIYRSFYPETYEVDADGNIQELSLAGRTYFAPVLTFGSGKALNYYALKSWHFNTNLMFLFNYNTGILPLLNFEIGFCFDFKKSKSAKSMM